MTSGLQLVKNVLTPLAESVLISSGLTAAASDAAIQNEIEPFLSKTTCQCFFRMCQNAFLPIFLKESPRRYLNFTIKETMRGERAKNETFRNALSQNLVIIWTLVILS